MAAFNFPNNPTNGQTVTVGNVTYAWNGSYWDAAVAGSSGPGYTGSRGSTGYTGSSGSSGGAGAGYTGSTGGTGFVGSRGYTGSVGYTGSTPDLSGYATISYVQTAGRNSQGTKTVSTAAPTGTGTPGDVWYVV